MYRKLINAVLALCFFAHVGNAHAYILILDNLSSGYSSCSWVDNGDGTSRVGVTIAYKAAAGHTGIAKFASRGILVYGYDKSGTPNTTRRVTQSVSMDGTISNGVFIGDGYFMYNGGASDTAWKNQDAMVVRVEAVVINAAIGAWPAIAIRAGNYTSGDDVGEINGAAYLARDALDGTCTVVDPTVPPPPPFALGVTAPDWDLGELPRGDSSKTLSRPVDQLCFTYPELGVGMSFVIDADNANGRNGNRYRLANVSDPTQTISYRVTLDGGTRTLSLPNVGNIASTFTSNGRTCFTPTFETSVDERALDGDYFDVLTFTVTTRS